jgi:hypothetical protein
VLVSLLGISLLCAYGSTGFLLHLEIAKDRVLSEVDHQQRRPDDEGQSDTDTA